MTLWCAMVGDVPVCYAGVCLGGSARRVFDEVGQRVCERTAGEDCVNQRGHRNLREIRAPAA